MRDIHGNSQLCMYEIEIPRTDCQNVMQQDDFDIDGYEDTLDAWYQWFEYLSAICCCQMFVYDNYTKYRISFDMHDDAIEFKLKYM